MFDVYLLLDIGLVGPELSFFLQTGDSVFSSSIIVNDNHLLLSHVSCLTMAIMSSMNQVKEIMKPGLMKLSRQCP